MEPSVKSSFDDAETLRRELADCQQQKQELLAKLEAKDKELQSIQELIKPVCEEYDEIKNLCDIETVCRQEAENYAAKVTKENKVLRRKSQAFLLETGGEVPVEEESTTERKYRQRKDDKMKALENEVSHLRARVKQQDLDIMEQTEQAEKATARLMSTRKELAVMKKSLNQHKETLNQLSQLSLETEDEYRDLRQKLLLEKECRSKAVDYAAKLHSQTEVMKRQSNILLSSVMSDEKLAKAMVDLEILTEQLNSCKATHQSKVHELKSQLEALNSSEILETLRNDLRRCETENERLQQEIADCRTQHEDLTKEYDELKGKYNEASAPPPPPPPPPLPPVFNTVPKQMSMVEKIRERNLTLFPKDKEDADKKKKGPDYQDAIKNMIDEIKKGRTLRPTQTRRPSCPESTNVPGGGVVMELNQRLASLGRRFSEPDASKSCEETDSSIVEEEKSILKLTVSQLSRRFEVATKNKAPAVFPRKKKPKSEKRDAKASLSIVQENIDDEKSLKVNHIPLGDDDDDIIELRVRPTNDTADFTRPTNDTADFTTILTKENQSPACSPHTNGLPNGMEPNEEKPLPECDEFRSSPTVEENLVACSEGKLSTGTEIKSPVKSEAELHEYTEDEVFISTK